jgi:hypothetical protein
LKQGVLLMPPESNAIASQNGCEMENIIKILYPGAQFEYRGLIDLHINGKPVEIKSCQMRTIDRSHGNNKSRSGRFIFIDFQHQHLLENNGEYILLVHEESVPILYFRVPAHILNLSPFSGSKCITWQSIVREAIA